MPKEPPNQIPVTFPLDSPLVNELEYRAAQLDITPQKLGAILLSSAILLPKPHSGILTRTKAPTSPSDAVSGVSHIPNDERRLLELSLPWDTMERLEAYASAAKISVGELTADLLERLISRRALLQAVTPLAADLGTLHHALLTIDPHPIIPPATADTSERIYPSEVKSALLRELLDLHPDSAAYAIESHMTWRFFHCVVAFEAVHDTESCRVGVVWPSHDSFSGWLAWLYLASPADLLSTAVAVFERGIPCGAFRPSSHEGFCVNCGFVSKAHPFFASKGPRPATPNEWWAMPVWERRPISTLAAPT